MPGTQIGRDNRQLGGGFARHLCLSGIIIELLTGKFPAQHATVNPPFFAMRQVWRAGDQSITAVLVHGPANEIEPRPSCRVANTRQSASSLRSRYSQKSKVRYGPLSAGSQRSISPTKGASLYRAGCECHNRTAIGRWWNNNVYVSLTG